MARVTAFDEKTVNFSITCFQGPKFEGQVLSRRRSFAQVLHDRAHARMLRECPMCMHAHALTPCLISTQQHAEETCPQLAGRLALVRACAARGALCIWVATDVVRVTALQPQIGRATHTRAIVDRKKFLDKAAQAQR